MAAKKMGTSKLLKVSRPVLDRNRGNTRKRGPHSEAAPVSFRETIYAASSKAKGGGQKWLKMASAMEAALERMRAAWQWIEQSGIPVARKYQDQSRDAEIAWRGLQEEVTAAAKILQIGLKAR